MGFSARCFLFEAGLLALGAQLFLSAPQLDTQTTAVLLLLGAVAHLSALVTILGITVARRRFGARLARALCVGMAALILVATVRDFFGVLPVPQGAAGAWLLLMIAGYGLVYVYWSTVRILPRHHRPLWHFPGRFGRTA